MLDRCYNPNNASFKNYGNRGISVCEEWLHQNGRYEFIEWSLNNGAELGLSIDRIDTDGNYSPDNCKWSTQKEQLNNQRRNHKISFNGRTQTLTEWANELGINPNTLQRRIRKYSMTVDKAFTPVLREWKHGTRQGYEFHKCRCDECRESNNKRHRERRKAKANE